MFRKVLFISMADFSFIWYTLTELFSKPDNRRQIYKLTSSTFHIIKRCVAKKKLLDVITRLRNSCLIAFLKKYRSSHPRCRISHRRCSVRKGVLKNFANFRGKHLCSSLFYEVAGIQHASFLKRDPNTSAFL